MARPRHLDGPPVAVEADMVDAVEALELVRPDPERAQLTDRLWRQRVATRFRSRVLTAFDDDSLMAFVREMCGGRGARRAAADDEDVDGLRHSAPGGDPGAGSVPIGMMSNVVSSVSNPNVPPSSAAKISESSEHHVSNSSANSPLGSAPPSV